MGFIKLDRCIIDSDIWTGGNKKEKFDRAHAWIDLLLMANYRDQVCKVSGKEVLVSRGQILTSIRKLSDRWVWAENTVRSFLRYLEGVQMILRSDGPKCIILTVTNYDKYQAFEGSATPSTIPSTIPSTDAKNTPSLNPSLKGSLNPLEESKESIFNYNIYTTRELDMAIDRLAELDSIPLSGEEGL